MKSCSSFFSVMTTENINVLYCAKTLHLCLTFYDPIDCSLTGFSVQARILKQVAISRPPLHCPPGNLPDPGIESESLRSPALAGGLFNTNANWEAQKC